MTYELVKQLKDAGFSQTFPDGRFYYTDQGELTYACEDHGDVDLDQTHGIVPTLSELIEACVSEQVVPRKIEIIPKNSDIAVDEGPIKKRLIGDKAFFLCFLPWKNIWVADIDIDGESFWYSRNTPEGKTPEEAVAKLWLALASANNDERA